MFDKFESWEIWLAIIVCLFFGFYIYNNVDFENLLKPDSPIPVHINGQFPPTYKFKNVKAVSIPQAVYDSMTSDSAESRYLKGNQKYVVMVTSWSCPYAVAFKQAFKRVFEEKEYSEYYRKYIKVVGKFVSLSCKDPNCSKIWIFRHCSSGFCIINPIEKRAIIYESNNHKQIEEVLDAYKEW